MNYWVDHFYRSSLFAKALYIVMFGMSVVVWAIMFRKLVLFRRFIRDNTEFLKMYRKNRRDPLALRRVLQGNRRTSAAPLAGIFIRGCEEIEAMVAENPPPRRRDESADQTLSILQIESLEEILYAEADRIRAFMESGQNFMATTSSLSPLLGLLGTVWGILQAFRNIGLQGSATAASMAPGLAEALITTVVGLVVAIPANLGYNFFGQRAKNLALEGDNFITEFITNLKRFWGIK